MEVKVDWVFLDGVPIERTAYTIRRIMVDADPLNDLLRVILYGNAVRLPGGDPVSVKETIIHHGAYTFGSMVYGEAWSGGGE